MTKADIQKRVLKDGKPLPLSGFIWDNENRKFGSDIEGLVIDFRNLDRMIVDIANYCTITTGAGCTITAKSYCTITTGSNCTITTKSYCTLESGYGCTIHSEELSVLIIDGKEGYIDHKGVVLQVMRFYDYDVPVMISTRIDKNMIGKKYKIEARKNHKSAWFIHCEEVKE